MTDLERRDGARAEGTSTTAFVKTGEDWTIRYQGAAATLKDNRGLNHIHHLLQYPGQEFHAIELQGRISGELAEASEAHAREAEAAYGAGDLGDAGEMLDARAKSEYKRRLR